MGLLRTYSSTFVYQGKCKNTMIATRYFARFSAPLFTMRQAEVPNYKESKAGYDSTKAVNLEMVHCVLHDILHESKIP